MSQTPQPRPSGIAALAGDAVTATVVGSNATASLVRVTINTVDASGSPGTITVEQLSSTARTYPSPQAQQVQASVTLVSASAQVISGTLPTSPGALWVYCDLRRGGSVIAVILVGYVYRGSNGPSFPGTPIGVLDSVNGRIYNVAPASPAAGAEISITVPSQAIWRVMSLQFTLVTDTVVNNRTHHLTVDDGTTANKIEQGLGETPTQAASTTRNFIYQTSGWTALETAFDAANFIRLPLRLPANSKSLPGGARIKTVSTLLDAGDQYTINQLWVEEWFTG